MKQKRADILHGGGIHVGPSTRQIIIFVHWFLGLFKVKPVFISWKYDVVQLTSDSLYFPRQKRAYTCKKNSTWVSANRAKII